MRKLKEVIQEARVISLDREGTKDQHREDRDLIKFATSISISRIPFSIPFYLIICDVTYI
jgi:hypothetical protein